mmetsp:Transcript_2958/g.3513  ORF Transcript_2958/g.3513 Transcript_2958/m.3513 type:complete len:397 (-) Transcript_2958:220-1410(-)
MSAAAKNNNNNSNNNNKNKKNSKSNSNTTNGNRGKLVDPSKCAKCGKPNPPKECSRCTVVFYCDKKCQKADFKYHKKNVCHSATTKAIINENNIYKDAVENCAGCGGSCSCTKDKDSPMARWRKQDGKEVFMGIVSYNRNMPEMIKLDNPRDMLGDPTNLEGLHGSCFGHVMNDGEFMSECAHYDDSTSGFKEEYNVQNIGSMLHNYSNKPNYMLEDNVMRSRCAHLNGRGHYGGDLVRYPFYNKDTEIYPPYSRNPPPLVRSEDGVLVVADRSMQPLPYPIRERFWVDVVSVTSSGIVTGVSRATLHHFDVKRGDWVYFPIWSVLDVEHGQYWASTNNNQNENDREKVEKLWKDRANEGWNFRNGIDETDEALNAASLAIRDELGAEWHKSLFRK